MFHGGTLLHFVRHLGTVFPQAGRVPTVPVLSRGATDGAGTATVDHFPPRWLTRTGVDSNQHELRLDYYAIKGGLFQYALLV